MDRPSLREHASQSAYGITDRIGAAFGSAVPKHRDGNCEAARVREFAP
jgi:hypothetical protein